jgi:hypothetical protein
VVHVKTKILPAPAPTGMIARGNNMKSDPAAARSQAQPAQKLGVDSRAQGKKPTTTRVHEFDRVFEQVVLATVQPLGPISYCSLGQSCL